MTMFVYSEHQKLWLNKKKNILSTTMSVGPKKCSHILETF